MREFASDEVDIDFEEEIGQGGTGVVYEARIRPSGDLVAVKVLHALYKYDEVKGYLESYEQVLKDKIMDSEIRERLVMPLGYSRLRFGQKQCILILPLAKSTLQKELWKRRSSILPLLQWTTKIAEIAESLTDDEVMSKCPKREMLFCHREIKPIDILLFEPEEGQSLLEPRWFPGLPLPLPSHGIATTKYTDPALAASATAIADADADVFSISVLLWEIVERREASTSGSISIAMPQNPLVPRELRMCIELGASARRDRRPSTKALCNELRYAVRAMYQRETEDADYRQRKHQQDALKEKVFHIFNTAVEQIQNAYQEAAAAGGVGYAVEVEAEALGGHIRLAVGSSAASVDLQYRRGDALCDKPFRGPATLLPTVIGEDTTRLFMPPLSIFEDTIEHHDPAYKQSKAFTEVMDAVETIDLSDGTHKTTAIAVRISNYRHLSSTPNLEYPEAGVEGFLCEASHIQQVDLTPLAAHVRKVGDYFLAWCSGLTHISLAPLEHVCSVGFAFLAHCRALSELDLEPFHLVESVGGSFLYNCSRLSFLDVTPLEKVRDLGMHSNFLCGCTGLQRIKLPKNIPIEIVRVHIGRWVEENDEWWRHTNGVRVYFIPRLEPGGGN